MTIAFTSNLLLGFDYKPGWIFEVGSNGCAGPVRFLVIRVLTEDSYQPERQIQFVHSFAIPDGQRSRGEWQRWLLHQILLVEQHEACEFFRVLGERPFAPHHFGSGDPYAIREAKPSC